MSIDGNAVAALISALAEIPGRLAALERAVGVASAETARIGAALPPTLVPVPEAASVFKVSIATMRRWVKAGAVPVVKIGSTVRVDLSRLHGTDDLAIARSIRMGTASRG